jgi:microcystin degradation protein MlrC
VKDKEHSMHYFLACLGTETNTFSSIPTGRVAFGETMLCRGDGTSRGKHPIAEPLRIWRRRAEAAGSRVTESICAFAEPAGTTVRAVYEQFRDDLLEDLNGAAPVDVVLLSLHGAMVAEGYVSTESDMLTRVRAVVGPDVTIGVELDLHCHITPAMVANADLIVTYKEYPHTDIPDRAEEVFAIATARAKGELRTAMAMAATGINAYMPTTGPAMRGFVDGMRALEGKDGVLSISLGHGFPHGDVPNLGATAIAVTDGDKARAKSIANRVAARLREIREALRPRYQSIDEALDSAVAEPRGPVVIADTSDNAGCGAPNDSTFVLRRILERGLRNVACANYWDPTSVKFCLDAGVGATIKLRIGGKCGPDSGEPVDLEVTIKGVADRATQTFNGFEVDMGAAAWVQSNGVDIILNSRRFQTGHPNLMTRLGLDPTTRKIVVVKSTQHFYAGFAPIASRVIYMAGPGATNPDTTRLPYQRMRDPFWPRDDVAVAGSTGAT